MPFTSSFNLKTTPQNAVVLANAKPEYLNCRALSPRRLDIHGAFTVCAKVVSKAERENVCAIDGDDVQMMKASFPVTTVTGSGQQLFTVSEDIELGSGKPPVESILRTDAKAYLTECKAITNKMMIKGDLNLKVLYLADLDTGAVEVLDYTIPINQIIDADGVDENASCDTVLEVMTYDVRVRNDLSESDTILSLEAKLCATVTSYGEDEAQLVTDAYSTVYDLDLTFGQVQLPRLMTIINDTYVNKSTVESSSSGITKMLDLWNEQCTVKALEENGRMVLTGKFNVCILALDSEDAPFYTERAVDFTYPLSLDGEIKTSSRPRVRRWFPSATAWATAASWTCARKSSCRSLYLNINPHAPSRRRRQTRSTCARRTTVWRSHSIMPETGKNLGHRKGLLHLLRRGQGGERFSGRHRSAGQDAAHTQHIKGGSHCGRAKYLSGHCPQNKRRHLYRSGRPRPYRKIYVYQAVYGYACHSEYRKRQPA